jgi:hypothetical protein
MALRWNAQSFPASRRSAMSPTIELTPCLFAIALAGLLTACDSNSDPRSVASPSPQSAAGTVIANDCRSPDAQSTQRGCRPTTHLLGGL